MPRQSENIVTQEGPPFSPPGTPTASGDEGTGTQYFDSTSHDVEMEPQLARDVHDMRATPLFEPDPDSPLHGANFALPFIAKRSSEDMATDSAKRMKRTASLTARRANRQLVDETERQKKVLKDQELRLLETLSQQQVILEEFRKVQQTMAQERDNFQVKLANAEREKADREAELSKEIQTIQAAKDMEVAAIVQRTNRNQTRSRVGRKGGMRENRGQQNVTLTQEHDVVMEPDETNDLREAASNNSEPSTSRQFPAVQVDNSQQVGGPTGNSSQNPISGTNWQKINAKVKANRAKSRMILDYQKVAQSEVEEGDEDEDEGSNGEEGGDSSDSDEECSNKRRKGKSKSLFESEEAFEKMMKKIVSKALSEFQSRKKSRTQRGNEERAARKKKAEKEKYGEDKHTRNQFCALIREVFSEKFGVTTDEDYALHQPPLRNVVKLYNNDKGPGPDPKNLQIDMRSRISKPWNQEVADFLLLDVLRKMKDDDNWNFLPERSDAYFIELIETKMERAKSYWTMAQPKYKEDGEKETIAETEARMVTWKDSKETTGRADARRQSRYIRRVKTLDRTIELKEEEGARDLESWRWIRSVVVTLGDDGMSSDESDEDDEGVTIFRPKTMPWRVNVETMMKNIDKQSMIDKELFSQKGAKPGYRSRKLKRGVSRRDAPTGRPRPFYDKEWLKQQSEKKVRRLNISKDKFPWMKLDK